MWLLVVCAEVTDSFLKGVAYVLTELGPAWFGIVGGSAVLGIIALRVRDRRFHRLLAVAVFVTYAAWTLSMFRSI
jgi:hypothetical protein